MVVDVLVTKEDVALFFGSSYCCAAVVVMVDLAEFPAMDATVAEVTAYGSSYLSCAVATDVEVAAEAFADSFSCKNQKNDWRTTASHFL